MNEKIYFLPDDDREYSFDEINALILDGSIRKNSLIWEQSLPDWVRVAEHPDFIEIFLEHYRIADEKIKQVLGTDDETVQKREMLKMLDDASVENHTVSQPKSHHILKWIAIGIGIVLLPVIVFSIMGLFKKETPQKAAQKQPVIEDINLEDVRFGSGVMKIDSVKGIVIKKVERSVEDTILKEMLLEIKKENEAEQAAESAKETQPEKKSAGLFDKVSDEELDAFRNSFMKKTGSKNVSAKVSTESKLAQNSEELTQDQINETIKNYSGTIKFCYDKALKNNDGISGKMEITIHIMGNGSVAKVVNETPKFKGTEMDRCVTEQIKKKWLFPKFNGTLSTVTIPFILSAQ